jgi:hypothetical protein
LGRAIARHQILVVAQWLLRGEALNSGKVRPHRQLRHSQGNPGALTDTALDGGGNTAMRSLEPVLPTTWGDP